MGERFELLINQVRNRLELEEIPIAPELAAPQTNERGVRIRSYNWSADRFEKISMMDTLVEVPPMNQLNSMFYPAPAFDIPIFLFLTVVTKSNIIAIFNACCPFADDNYQQTYITPLLPILDRYPPFSGKNRDPEWFEKYRTNATVFGVFAKDQIDVITECGLALLDQYLQTARQAKPVEDETRLASIGRFHELFRQDIRTKDVGRSVMAKLTDDETARRTFYEVAT